MRLAKNRFKVLLIERLITLIRKLSITFLSSSLGYILEPFILHKFRSLAYDINNIYDAIDFTFSFKYFVMSIKPYQVKYEIMKLLELINECKPKVLIEIGTAGGGTLFLFTRVVDPEGVIISIDLPGGPFGGGYPKWKTPIYKSFARCGQKIYLIRADSHNPDTLERVKKILENRNVDFLFIDGDHRYDGVKKDFDVYSLLVKNGGMIALHDIVEHPPETECEVNRFWNKIKNNYRYIEIVKDRDQKWAGIGVIYF